MPLLKRLTGFAPVALAIVILVLLALSAATVAARAREPQDTFRTLPRDYPVRPVPFTDVKITDAFWEPRLETNRTVSIPAALKMNEETGRVDNFRKAARLMTGPYRGKRYNDSDVYKAMEGAAYTLMLHPDPALGRGWTTLSRSSARPRSRTATCTRRGRSIPRTPLPAPARSAGRTSGSATSSTTSGHMYEAAVAHYLATGERTFLDVAVKNADLLVRTFGPGPGQRRGFPGHQEVEIGLAKLFRATGRRAYLDLAKFFLDERGHYFGGEKHAPTTPSPSTIRTSTCRTTSPSSSRTRPSVTPSGPCICMPAWRTWPPSAAIRSTSTAIDRLWESVVGKKMYLTGGVGSRGIVEGFGKNYDLPNNAYAETCAAIGNALWNERLFLLHGDPKYVDVIERVMYNGLLSGVSLSGDRFFYQNPLESAGGYARSPWFEVACCPPNITRFLPSISGYIYAIKEDTVFVNLFVASGSRVDVNGERVSLIQDTDYPWDGTVKITVNPEGGIADFEVAVRIPGWARNEAVPEGPLPFPGPE